jgi:signal peptidase I
MSQLSDKVLNAILDIKKGEESLIVASSSMEPVLSPGDKIEIEAVDPSEIERGMVLVYEDCFGKKIVHRVIKRKGSMLITAGDNLRKFDDPVHLSQVIGKVKNLKVKKPLSKLARFIRAIKRRASNWL